MLFRHAPFLAVILNTCGLVAFAAEPLPATRPASLPATRPASLPATRPSTVPAATLENWFNDLAASDAVVRDKAFGAMLGLQRDDLPTLRRIVERSRPVAPAQSAVLHDIVTHVYLTDEPYDADGRAGFLGLLYPVLDSVDVPVGDGGVNGGEGEAAIPRSGVPIENRLPGFCAFRELRDGDVVLGIVAPTVRRLRDWSELSLTVQTFRGGETVTFEVLRQGQLLNVPIRLDARPIRPNEKEWQDEIIPNREAVSEEYWTEHFQPLVEDRISSATE